MNYLLQSRRKTKNPVIKIFVILLLCFVFGILFKNPINNGFIFIHSFINNTINFLIPSGLRSNKEVITENELLRKKVIDLQAEVVDRQVLKSENDNIKAMLGRNITSLNNEDLLLATITKSPRETQNDIIILDVGEDSDVGVGDKVVVGNLLIGLIVEVGNNYSKARLYSSPQNAFSGILVKDNIKMEVKGVGGGQFQASVPIGSSASVGDTFILPSISPKVFGLVKEVVELQSEGFKLLLFSLPININQISHVLILK